MCAPQAFSRVVVNAMMFRDGAEGNTLKRIARPRRIDLARPEGLAWRQNPLNIVTDAIPIAKPAKPVVPKVEIKPRPRPRIDWRSAETYRGWPSSLIVHTLILIIMALWILSPPPRAKNFDSRLMGADLGADDGLTLSGGLNSELEMVAAIEKTPEIPLSPTLPLELTSLEATLPKPAETDKATVGGAFNNPNPGAGQGDGFGLARFGEGGENIKGVEVKVGDPQFTLIWDTNVDLDLHVIEPGGKEIHTFDRKSTKGGELDVDNMKGFGPENIYWMHEDESTGEKMKGQGPAGEYRWFVVYWGGFDGAPKATHWKVRIKHAGKVTIVTGRLRSLNEQSRTYTLKVGP